VDLAARCVRRPALGDVADVAVAARRVCVRLARLAVAKLIAQDMARGLLVREAHPVPPHPHAVPLEGRLEHVEAGRVARAQLWTRKTQTVRG
jgi:hypothetical protein